MPFRIERNCKICQSKIRSKIDDMILKNVTQPLIKKFAANHNVFISKPGITRHKKNHCDFSKEELAIARDNKKAKEQHEISVNKYVSATEFLEKLTSDVFAQIENGTLKPTIDHGLKAIELQAKLKEGNLIEKTLIDFMMQFTPESISPTEIPVTISDTKETHPLQLEQPKEQIMQEAQKETDIAQEAVLSLIAASRAGELTGNLEDPQLQEEEA